ncbi:amidohydrolase family protein [Pararobbsia silviterrae]|uniref:N-acyl-D-amino-acid deacylase n=1 Tax=Pararobbsia silviterrae TaxID=1792498 RepID=A0A494Y226_9BURK|nr:amidohydrolase family protein [Pararobbsia silviterrae]RKP56757.1 N-acyl-D-amino-acid deacylase [Pararobbsia silviterrae]
MPSLADRSADLVIRRARVRDDAPLTDIAIREGRIVAVATDLDVDAVQTLDVGGRATLPGFIEAHIHLDKALLARARPSVSGTLDEAIRVTGELKARRDRADMLERASRVIEMAVQHGTTTLRAHPDVDPIQGLLGVEVMLELRERYRDLVDLQIVAFPQEGLFKAPGTEALLIEALRLGADVMGACPYNETHWDDTVRHIDRVFEIAARFGVDLDMHADFADDTRDPRFAAVSQIARKTIEMGYEGRVSLGHVTSLGAVPPDQLGALVDALRRADIHIVTLPATDLYLGGRTDTHARRRGLTPVRDLLDGGVNVAYASNNVRNAFTPFGNADMLHVGNLLAHAAQLGTPADQARVLEMATTRAARAIGLRDYGIAVGNPADLVVLDGMRVDEALLDLPPRSWVIKRGRIAVTTRHCCELHRAHALQDTSQ